MLDLYTLNSLVNYKSLIFLRKPFVLFECLLRYVDDYARELIRSNIPFYKWQSFAFPRNLRKFYHNVKNSVNFSLTSRDCRLLLSVMFGYCAAAFCIGNPFSNTDISYFKQSRCKFFLKGKFTMLRWKMTKPTFMENTIETSKLLDWRETVLSISIWTTNHGTLEGVHNNSKCQ